MGVGRRGSARTLLSLRWSEERLLGFLTTDAIVEITGLLHPFRMDPLIVMKPR
jgi:hypothetical protein